MPLHTENDSDRSGGAGTAIEQVRKVIEDWALYRDSAQWEKFATVWHADGWMSATWFQGPFTEFIEVSRAAFDRGGQILHFLGGFTCEFAGDRAIAQTKMKIEQRAQVDETLVDVTCTGRFFDFLERCDGRWGIVRRQPIYESDRMDVVDPATTLELDAAVLESFPAGYRHLGYLQENNGYRVMRDLPGLRGPAVEVLYNEGRGWLDGSATPGVMRRNDREGGS
jgi:hypothetical protein